MSDFSIPKLTRPNGAGRPYVQTLADAVDASAGVSSAGSVPVLDATGKLSPTMLPSISGGGFDIDDGAFTDPESSIFNFDDESF